jgi:hypothetical protein
MHYVLFYELALDYLERRAALRDEHLALAWQAQGRGELLLARVNFNRSLRRAGQLTFPLCSPWQRWRADQQVCDTSADNNPLRPTKV